MPYKFDQNQFDLTTLGLYLHVPFCVRKCAYCDFYSVSAGRKDQERYHTAMMKAISWAGAEAKGRIVDTVYVGGGTPSCYPAELFTEELRKIQETFTLTHDCEITVECNPDSATEEWLAAIREAGVNRLSMGVQSADDTQLKRVGRLHNFQTARDAFFRARRAGFDNISLDLIYGLPDQTMESWQHTVEALIALNPEHLSCYGLKLEEGTPLFKERETLTLADDDGQADMYLWMVDRLEQAGYHQYEISNFGKQGRLSRHNFRYWLGQEYIGLGPAAHSYFKNCRRSIPRSLEQFCKAAEMDAPIWDEISPIDPREKAREYILLGLRTMWGIEAEEIKQRFGLSFAPIQKELEYFRTYGWTACEQGRWHFTPEGFLRSNTLIGMLEEILDDQLSCE